MTDITEETLADTARAYDRWLMPALFAPWIPHTLDRSRIQPGQHLLDVACGTGELALSAQQRVQPDGLVTGLDLNPGMLAVAREKSETIRWVESHAGNLPFDEDTFDAVTCQFGLMLFDDPVQALREMHRVLEPGGRLVVLVFDELIRQPVYQTLSELYGDLISPSVGDLLRAPFAMGQRSIIENTFAEAGLAEVEVERLEESVIFPTITDLIRADVDGWFPFAGVRVTADQRERVSAAAARALAPYRMSDGSFRFVVGVHCAWLEKNA
ncbi:class I SAM-dependent methyltransferase [Marinobacter sp. JSM 1782161]|uniref:class I SAM-dependent methyltransferase n=1 Tax=Marinobacter sp. JSM 1782161 TaxID=2685906 RepID=UPI001402A908|nr:class I SAM-dependent methyltransferase [Marinobacter sp. JSM 1782161]